MMMLETYPVTALIAVRRGVLLVCGRSPCDKATANRMHTGDLSCASGAAGQHPSDKSSRRCRQAGGQLWLPSLVWSRASHPSVQGIICA